MLDFTRNWVTQIVSLVLFIVMIEILLPKGKMRKYVGLITGTILIIAIINPLISFFGNDFNFIASQTTNSNLLNKMQVEKDSKLLEQTQMDQIVEVYRKNIIEQIENNAREIQGVQEAEADIIINEDYSSPAFGEIKRAYLRITPESVEQVSEKESKQGSDVDIRPEKEGAAAVDAWDNSSNIKKVESVKIGKVSGRISPENKCDPKLVKQLEDKIGQVFGVKRENIIISNS